MRSAASPRAATPDARASCSVARCTTKVLGKTLAETLGKTIGRRRLAPPQARVGNTPSSSAHAGLFGGEGSRRRQCIPWQRADARAVLAPARRVLVLGGYGAFGGRASTQLARQGIDVIVAGRSLPRAREFAASLAKQEHASIEPLQMDAATAGPSELAALRAAVVINASGPFQLQDYRLARACIGAGAHYIDLADARAFVAGITSLDAEARRAGVLVVAGASTVPALSSAVLDAYAPQMATLEAACIVIAPSNSFDPGIATTRSILRMLGRPFAVPHGGSTAIGYGWQGLQRRCVAELGARWLGLCEVPDLDLLPARHAGLGSVRVYAALEVGAFHLCLWGLSWLVRAGVLRNAERLANPLLAVKRAFGFLGSDVSGMAITLIGQGRDGMARRIDWRLIARGGCGPYVPATPSVLLAKQLLAGKLAARGATPCVGLLTLADFIDEFIGFDITAGVL